MKDKGAIGAKMYYWIRESWKLENSISETPDVENEEIDFMAGKIITEKLPLPIRFETTYKSGNIPHQYYDHGTDIPVIGKFLFDLFEKSFVNNYQVFPAILYNPKYKIEWKDFFAFNVIGTIDATDLSASKCDVIMPGNKEGVPSLYSFTYIALKENKIKGLDMFRESSGNNLIFSERLLDYIFSFDPPNNGKFGIIAHEVILT